MARKTMTREDFQRVVLRRETTTSRAGTSVFAAALVLILCVYVIFEAILALLRLPGWLMDPDRLLESLASLPEGVSPLILVLVGLILIMLGLFFFIRAVSAGRKPRHAMNHDTRAVVVDDEVIASALARRARLAAGVSPAQVMVTISGSRAVVNIRPTSGLRVDAAAVTQTVQEEVEAMGINPAPAVSVHVASSGVVGA